LLEAWGKNLEDRANPFDESIEKLWIRQWLFYANTVRYASAMTRAQDYATFKNGWWEMTENLQKMKDLMEMKSRGIAR
jgi:hydroxylamine dehydrogenase